jgi:CelD/BcsL family acetyltransferase involved in cellulose biosynthesis
MTKPVLGSAFVQRSPAIEARVVDGLPRAIDAVAEGAGASHRFLRQGWFAAALAAYGGTARTLIVKEAGAPVLALPFVPLGPGLLRAAQLPGCYWPFRSVPIAEHASDDVADAALAALARELRAFRFGPVYDGDPALEALRAAAVRAGWAAIDRRIADSFLLDIAAQQAVGGWPRGSTLKKNRFHEKHLGAHGALDWSFASGADWTPAMFDALAKVERASWVAERTSGDDAKFTHGGHGAFWRAAAADPVIAQMMWAAVLRVDDKPAAFSFDLNAGSLKYAIANSYDSAFAKHSPGKLLYYRNLVRAMADGIARVDWGAGDSGYKTVIGAAPGPAIRDWLFVRPGVSALAARLLAGMWRRSGR